MSTEHTEHIEHAHHKDSFVDRYWPAGLVLFGVTFVSILIFFHPAF